MLRCAKDLGLKARAPTTKWERLASTPLPGIAALRDGGFLILGKVDDDKVLIQLVSSPRPEVMTRAQFEAVWDGRLVLMARRATLSDLTRRFDITWFLGAIHKYRHLLGEVLVISFFLQLFALISPLLRSSQPEHARRIDDRAGGHCAIRGDPRHSPHVSVRPYHEPD
jgi:ATP-binding cassette, subfamily B, bacterial HlyB/CyaB